MKKLKFRYNGKTQSLEGSTHAALFREFFDWWKEKDLEATIFGTFESGLRLSDEEYFEGQVIKKKNLMIVEDMYVITHITPQAMDKGIINFLNALDCEIIEPKLKDDKVNNKNGNNKTKFKPSKSLGKSNQKHNEHDVELANDLAKKLAHEEISMAELVKQKMKERNEAIKARLANGNRPISEEEE